MTKSDAEEIVQYGLLNRAMRRAHETRAAIDQQIITDLIAEVERLQAMREATAARPSAGGPQKQSVPSNYTMDC